MLRMPPLCCLFSSLALVAACESGTIVPDAVAPDDGVPPITVVGATLIDGTGAAPIEDAVIVIRGNRIVSIGSRSDTATPEGGEIVDGTGKFVIPGLVDLHCHFGGGRAEVERVLGVQLRFGVTTARSLGSDGEENLALVADVRAGKVPGPRLYTAGRGFSAPGGMPSSANAPTSEEEAVEMVRALAAQNVDLVKMWVETRFDTLPEITPEMRTAIVREAAAHGIPAAAHIYDEEDVRQLADLGVTDFIHSVRDREVDASFVAFARQKKLSFAPALTQAQNFWYLVENPEVLNDPEFRDSYTAERADRMLSQGREQMMANPLLEERRRDYARALVFIKTMHDGGVRIAVGSDSGAGVAFGWGAHHEMQQLVVAGLEPVEAIAAATGNGARVLEGDDAEFGVLAAGKIADLVLLDADPLADIGNTRKIARVMQGGNWLERR